MPRPTRVDFPGAIHHITSRGDRRETIYRDDIDRQNWLRVLSGVCSKYAWSVHAFCQMGNHYHLVVEMAEANLARGMRQLNGLYTQRFNYRHAGSGHVFQARYHSELVHRQAHLIELMRYVVLNPVRAGIVGAPGDWPWSSFAMTSGVLPAPRWLQIDWVLSQFSGERDEAIHAYRRFVMEGAASGLGARHDLAAD
ncbi:transposase [Massilia sp. R2A-15]|uniref:transposase n=1 Tax=Massilia sp. R2A-15 TaxID=3064278 RepID=UPI0027371BC0|nr:transposase [Massilia sp. R2A-15]WLI88853.1 transposase [Massilia sp. R2A-15]